MEVPSIRNRIGGNWSDQLLSSRRGALTVAAVAAVLAGLLLYLFVQHYRRAPVVAAPAEVSVIVAAHYIPAGSLASTVFSEDLLKRVTVPSSEAVAGAITDPSAITGEFAASSVAAGQQISVADFTHSVLTIDSYLTGDYRAIAIPFDASHGLTAYIGQGNTVDMMDDEGSKTVVIAQNVPILANAGGDVIFKVTDAEALTLAGAADSSKLWLTLRPPNGGKSSIKVGTQEGNL
jgi:Flp pilus assembly protein CpaB